jgi:NADPH-dependent 2,4-dienoyl-CoA reductase/sulfur reductase-like enzyme
MATDIIATHGQTKKVTLLHSRPNLLNRFDTALHEAAMKRMKEFGIEVILGSRVDGSFINKTEGGKVRTTDGREVEADLIVSDGSGASKFTLEAFSLTPM